ncbi:hypothetical protein, partial [Salmonella sp. s58758]|uniref:hypothetical protein n=1 Tax=Salmonella sp. s58758 TaxID=3159707 RepID=UPI0039805288
MTQLQIVIATKEKNCLRLTCLIISFADRAKHVFPVDDVFSLSETEHISLIFFLSRRNASHPGRLRSKTILRIC